MNEIKKRDCSNCRYKDDKTNDFDCAMCGGKFGHPSDMYWRPVELPEPMFPENSGLPCGVESCEETNVRYSFRSKDSTTDWKVTVLSCLEHYEVRFVQ